MSIIWKEEYNLGIASIDAQHKKFIDILNQLSLSFLKKSKRETLKKILSDLKEYATFHFSYEEKIFHDIDYKEIKRHEEEHAVFRKKIDIMQKRLEVGDDLLEYDMFLFVNDWLIVHIQQEDKKYASFFLSHNVK